LTGNLKGKLAMDLDHPYRLLFEPLHDLVPCKDDGGIDWTNITVLEILAQPHRHDKDSGVTTALGGACSLHHRTASRPRLWPQCPDAPFAPGWIAAGSRKTMTNSKSRDSASRLNLSQFTNPVAYQLKIATGNVGESRPVNVDLVET